MTSRNPKQAKARQSILEEHYKVDFLPDVDPRKWPQQHSGIFGRIQRLGDTQFDKWNKDLEVNWADCAWKRDTQEQVGCVVRKARECRNGEHIELEWRLALEHLLFKRFDSGPTCKQCGAMLWRPDLKITINQKGASVTPPKHRRLREKKVCGCSKDGPRPRTPIGASLFQSRADVLMRHDKITKEKLERAGEKPDRVYSLRQTGLLRTLLRSPSIASGGQQTLREELEPTLLPNARSPGVFPFLLLESKRAKGSSFEEINQQMGIVIYKSLSIQQRLHASVSSVSTWTHSPLCWAFSHVGAMWRLAAGYELNSMKQEFEVAALWRGDIDSPSGALQLILILDYICDWGRFVYRESMNKGLQNLTLRESEDLSDTMSSVFSVRSFTERRGIVNNASPKPAITVLQKLNRIGSWKSGMDVATPEDPFKQFDSRTGVIRDANFVHSQVMGLCITGSTFELLVNCVDSDKDARRLLRNIRKMLGTEEPLLMGLSDLKDMEIAWTGKSCDFWKRDDYVGSSSEESFHVLLTFSAFITPEWELKRELCYLAISESARKLLFKDVQRGRPECPIEERISPEAIAKFVKRHSQTSVAETLTACLNRSSNCACMRKRDCVISPEILFKDQNFIYFIEQFQGESSRDIVWSLYLRHKVGRNEPTMPLLRLLSRKDNQALLNEKVGHESSPWGGYNISAKERAVLAQSPRIDGPLVSRSATYCIFVLDREHATYMLPFTNTYFKHSFITEIAFLEDPQNITWNVTLATKTEGARRTGSAILAHVKTVLKFSEISDPETVSENASDETYETESSVGSEESTSDESDDQITDDEEEDER